MAKILFWNTNKNEDIDRYLVDLINENESDIVILAEYCNNIDGLCNKLSYYREFKPFKTMQDRIVIAASDEYEREVILDTRYYTMCNIEIFTKEFLLVALHFPSRLHADDETRSALASKVINDINNAMKNLCHDNVAIVGDFNSNPFDNSCINATCFHAVPSKLVANKRTRTVNGQLYNLYYNPMWNMFGDSVLPTGTYYYSKGGINTYFWNIFDQVILSPDAANAFAGESLKIVTSVNGKSLLNENEIPDRHNASDHLPIVFELREERL